MIKNLVFDFGGVLCDLNFEGCFKEFKKLGINEDYLNSDSMGLGIFQQFNIGTISEKEFIARLYQYGDNIQATYQQLLDAWNTVIVNIPPQRFEALKELEKNYNLYLLSNVNYSHWEYSLKYVWNYKGEPFTQHFKKLFLSYEMHKEKPNADIFEEVIQIAGINPKESLFIDDRQDNTTTALKVGFHTLQALGDEWIEKIVGKELNF